jgi:large subunit ribosomal protein L7/L12
MRSMFMLQTQQQQRLRLLLSAARHQRPSCNIRFFTLPSGSHLQRPRRRPLIASTTNASFHSTRNVFAEEAVQLAEKKEDVTESNGAPDPPTEGEEQVPHPTSIQYAFTPPPPLSEASQQKVDAIFGKIIWLDMIEVHMLTQMIHEKMGVNPSDVDNSGGPAGGASAAAASAEEAAPEKLLKDLKLVGFDTTAKIKVIKEVRSIFGLGLKEAKDLVESAPKIMQKDLKPEKAEELKAQLEAIGAVVEIV